MNGMRVLLFSALMCLNNDHGHSRPMSTFPLLYQVGQIYYYTYTTETLVNEANSPKTSPGQKDVGFKFSATLEMSILWSGSKDQLVKLAVTSPKIHSVSRPDLQRELRGLPRIPIYFQWDAGKVVRVFSSENDSTLAINIKKGVISMFQLKMEDGKHEELDASGECDVSYVKQGTIIKRIKNQCQNIETTGQYTTINAFTSISKESYSTMTYNTTDDLIQTATGLEEYTATVNMENSMTTKIITRQDLKLLKTKRGKQIQAADVEQAIQKAGNSDNLDLYGMILGTTFEPTPCPADDLAFRDKVSHFRTKLQPSDVGTSDAARAFIELVALLRSTSKDSVLAAFKDEENKDILGTLIDGAAAAQTSACQAALMAYLKFDDFYNIELPERYLLATAFTTHPGTGLLEDLLKLYKMDIPNEKLHETIGDALGAVLYTHCKLDTQCASKFVFKDVLSAFISRLESCTKAGCKPMVIRALSNAGVPETIPVLLMYAETANDTNVNEYAIKALRRMGRENMNDEVKAVMRRIFFQDKRGYDTAVRTQALKILLENGPTQGDMTKILLETTDPHNTDYDMYIQNRVFNLMEKDDTVKHMVQETLKDSNVSNWHILAPKGKALAFNNNMTMTPSMTSVYYMYTENSRAGIMKRSGMDVDALSPVQNMPVYNFGLYAAGMESLLGEEIEPGQEDVTPTAGMSLDLLDVSLRPISFFSGQSGLMSAVWNAPSEPVSALQTTLLLGDHLERVHLQNGLIAELSVQAAVSLDLSGSLSVSLWNKNAKGLIKTSGAVSVRSAAAITTSPFRSGVESWTDAAKTLNFNIDVDFYDGIKMCLQMGRPDFIVRQNVKKFEHARGFPKGYISRIRRSKMYNAQSYPLPRLNSIQCKQLLGNS